MKKASTNVDWVISLGIFLTYVLFLFIFLKPGIQEEYDQDSLFDILERNIYIEANYSLDTLPIYIDSSTSGYFEFECNNDFHYTDDWYGPYMALMDKNGGIFDGQEMSYTINSNKIKFNVFLQNGLNKFLILHSNRETYSDSVSVCGEEPCSGGLLNLDCIFGTKETFEGLYNEGLLTIYNNCNANYEIFKGGWNFPMSKEFSLHTKKDTDYENLCNGGFESNQSNIFVKEFKDILLDKYGDKEDILVNMRIW